MHCSCRCDVSGKRGFDVGVREISYYEDEGSEHGLGRKVWRTNIAKAADHEVVDAENLQTFIATNGLTNNEQKRTFFQTAKR